MYITLFFKWNDRVGALPSCVSLPFIYSGPRQYVSLMSQYILELSENNPYHDPAWYLHLQPCCLCKQVCSYRSGTNFTNELSTVIQIRWKVHYVLIQIVAEWSLWNFAHGAASILSWHVHHVCSDMELLHSTMELHWHWISIEFKLQWKIVREMGPRTWVLNIQTLEIVTMSCYFWYFRLPRLYIIGGSKCLCNTSRLSFLWEFRCNIDVPICGNLDRICIIIFYA